MTHLSDLYDDGSIDCQGAEYLEYLDSMMDEFIEAVWECGFNTPAKMLFSKVHNGRLWVGSIGKPTK
jgi:hypothetical protein